MLYSCPNHELSWEMIIQNFYDPLSLNGRNLLDTSCAGSYMMRTIEFRWNLLDIIKCNSEDWDLDEGKESGMTPKFIVLNLLWTPMFFVNLALNMDLTLR